MRYEIICNCCGKAISVKDEIPGEDFLHIKKQWGYFSNKDGQFQEMYVCESCFGKWTDQFEVPITTLEITEFV
jgi:ribosomal-protein-alanine N-acetyltransferase